MPHVSAHIVLHEEWQFPPLYPSCNVCQLARSMDSRDPTTEGIRLRKMVVYFRNSASPVFLWPKVEYHGTVRYSCELVVYPFCLYFIHYMYVLYMYLSWNSGDACCLSDPPPTLGPSEACVLAGNHLVQNQILYLPLRRPFGSWMTLSMIIQEVYNPQCYHQVLLIGQARIEIISNGGAHYLFHNALFPVIAQ